MVSVKTVEYHLANVYGKLGIRSRQELVPTFGPVDAMQRPRVAPSTTKGVLVSKD